MRQVANGSSGRPDDPGFARSLNRSTAFATLLLLAPLLVPLFRGRIFAHTDLAVFHLPLRRFYSMALVHGQSFVWTSNLFDGFYVHGEGQLGAFHPWHLFLYRVFPLTVAFNLEVILSYPFAFAGMWCFLWRIGVSAPSRTVGALCFAFSGFFVLHLGHPNAIAIAGHMPWLLLALDVTLSGSPRQRGLAACAMSLLIGSEVLLGYPQYVWISALACVLYAPFHGRLRPQRYWLPMAAAAAGALIGGVQLLPTMDLLAHSERASIAPGFALTFSLHPLNLLQLFSPFVLPDRVYAPGDEYYVHEFGVYNGAFCTLAVVWAVLRRDRLSFGRTALFAAVLCAVGVILALGRYGHVYDYLSVLPVIGKFRAPARHLVLLHLGLALLAALMFEDLIRLATGRLPAPRGILWLSIPLATGVGTVCIAALRPLWLNGSSAHAAYPAMLTGLGFMAAATLLTRDAARGVSAALVALPLLLAIDLGAWGYSYAWGSPPRTIDEIAAGASAPPGAMAGTSVHDETGEPTNNYLLLKDFRILRPYVGLFPRLVLTATDSDALRVGGVEWVNTRSGWRKVDDPMPRVRIVPAALLSHNPAADLHSVDIRRVALVDRDVPTPLARPEDATARLLLDQPGRLEFDVASPAPALLAITETFDAGWKVKSDPAPASQSSTLPLYGDYLGVMLVPGRYHLTLVFEPDSLTYGAYVSLAGLLAAGVLALAVGRRRR